jgi:GH43 family beta-xylosidase
VFTGNERVYGVGHASFVTTSDGAEHWMVYHSKDSPRPGWRRSVRMQPFEWSPEGDPQFGRAVGDGERIGVPRGECPSR